MSQQLVSIYTFDLNKNVAENQLVAASAKLDAILHSCVYPGMTVNADQYVEIA